MKRSKVPMDATADRQQSTVQRRLQNRERAGIGDGYANPTPPNSVDPNYRPGSPVGGIAGQDKPSPPNERRDLTSTRMAGNQDGLPERARGPGRPSDQR